MSEVISLANLYESIVFAGASSRGTKSPPHNFEQQCIEIDELWVELGNCIHHWRGYPAEFIATRFANLHYVKQGINAAHPPDEVWRYLVDKIVSQQRHRIVTIRHAHPGGMRSWI